MPMCTMNSLLRFSLVLYRGHSYFCGSTTQIKGIGISRLSKRKPIVSRIGSANCTMMTIPPLEIISLSGPRGQFSCQKFISFDCQSGQFYPLRELRVSAWFLEAQSSNAPLLNEYPHPVNQEGETGFHRSRCRRHGQL